MCSNALCTVSHRVTYEHREHIFTLTVLAQESYIRAFVYKSYLGSIYQIM